MYHLFHLVTTVKFANDDKNRLAFSSLDGSVSVCQLYPSAEVKVTLRGHSAGVTGKLVPVSVFALS